VGSGQDIRHACPHSGHVASFAPRGTSNRVIQALHRTTGLFLAANLSLSSIFAMMISFNYFRLRILHRDRDSLLMVEISMGLTMNGIFFRQH
jgi:hypothetical protein